MKPFTIKITKPQYALLGSAFTKAERIGDCEISENKSVLTFKDAEGVLGTLNLLIDLPLYTLSDLTLRHRLSSSIMRKATKNI